MGMTNTTAPAVASLEECDTAELVLTFARSSRTAAQAAETRLFCSAVAWADLHSEGIVPDSYGIYGDVLPGSDGFIELAGVGAPSVS